MPYAIRHIDTGTLFSCAQRNGYELAYYGLLLFEEVPDGRMIDRVLAEAGIGPAHPDGQPYSWESVALTVHEAKMANVKLRNDPRRTVRYADGKLEAATGELP